MSRDSKWFFWGFHRLILLMVQKSCPSSYGRYAGYTIIYRVLYILGGAGFQPSTVLGCPGKLGSIVSKWFITYFKNGVFLGVITHWFPNHLLTSDIQVCPPPRNNDGCDDFPTEVLPWSFWAWMVPRKVVMGYWRRPSICRKGREEEKVEGKGKNGRQKSKAS